MVLLMGKVGAVTRRRLMTGAPDVDGTVLSLKMGAVRRTVPW